jgi:hypothetical protein
MRRILAPALLVCAAAAFAQAPPAPAIDPTLPPRYEVEILVFAHRDFDPAEERFKLEPQAFGEGAGTTLREAPLFDETTFNAPLTPAPLEPAPLEPVDPLAAQRAEAFSVRPLAPEELKLNSEYRKLQAIAAYQPLVHAGWVLPGLPEADAVPFDLKTLGISNPRGTVRVHLSRFLHITLDLTYQAPLGAGPAAASAAANDGLDEILLAPQYRLRATRSARSNELHYFDHPAFGVLVRITPVTTTPDGGRRPAA